MEYLIILCVVFFIGLLLGGGITARFLLRKIDITRKISDNQRMYFRLMHEWVKKKQEGKCLSNFVIKLGYKKIAVYGMGDVGERLIDELNDSEVEVAYVIDKNARNVFSYVQVFFPNDNLEEVDAVIVTPIAFFDEIEDMLKKRLKCPIIAIDDLIYDM